MGIYLHAENSISMSRSAHEETRTPKTMMDKSLIGPAGRRDFMYAPQSSPVSL